MIFQDSFKQITLILSTVWMATKCSIAGVTYMDHFDFEQRYRNVHECDPFYWHPLHLPEDCADMFEKLIRSRLAARGPVRVLKPRLRPKIDGFSNYQGTLSYSIPYQYLEMPVYPSPETYPVPMEFEQSRELTPYEEMLESVRQDVKNQPSFPTMQVMPTFGAVALYHQPVSKKSADMIKELSMTYAGAAREATGYYKTPDNGDDEKRERKQGVNWKALVDKAVKRGWSKTNSGNIYTLTKNKP